MVDVSTKPATERTAVAEGRVVMSKATLELIVSGNASSASYTRSPNSLSAATPLASVPLST